MGAAAEIVESHFEPAVLVAESTAVLAANRGFAVVLGVPVNPERRTRLSEIAALGDRECRDLLTECLGAAGPVPIRLPLRTPGGVPRALVGASWRCRVGRRRAVVIRVSGSEDSVARSLAGDRPDAARSCASLASCLTDDELRTALERLSELEEVKDHMMAQISHDLRTPLNGILGLSEFILSEPFGRIDPRYRGYVDDIRHCGSELLTLVDRVLQLGMAGRPETGDATAVADLGVCLDACLRVVGPLAAQKRQMISRAPTMALPRLRADSVLVKQILYNLIGNAIKYTPPGGTVRVDGHWANDGFAIEIRDNGVGIARHELGRVFEPFYRSGDSYTSNPPGSGLGLALTRRSVELVGGSLAIESILGAGTCATVTLPAADAATRMAG